jgi:hypothetical protein
MNFYSHLFVLIEEARQQQQDANEEERPERERKKIKAQRSKWTIMIQKVVF